MYGGGAIAAWGALTLSGTDVANVVVDVSPSSSSSSSSLSLLLSPALPSLWLWCCMAMATSVVVAAGGAGHQPLQLRHVRSRERHSTERSKIRWGLQAFDNLTLSYDAYANETLSEETTDAAAVVSHSEDAAAAAASAQLGDVNQSLYAIVPNEMFHLDANEEREALGGSAAADGTSELTALARIDGIVVRSATTTASPSTNHAVAPTKVKKKVKKRKLMADIKADVDKGLAYIRMQSELGADVSSVPADVLKSFTADPVWVTPAGTTTSTTTPATPTTTTTTTARTPIEIAAPTAATQRNDQQNTLAAAAAAAARAALKSSQEKTPQPSLYKQEPPVFQPVVTTDASLLLSAADAANYTELNPFGGDDNAADDDRSGLNANDTVMGRNAAAAAAAAAAGTASPDYYVDNLEGLDETSRNNRINLLNGRDLVTQFLHIVETQHSLGSNCTAGTALNLGEGIVDRYAQDRFRVEAEIAVNRANMLTRIFKQASPAVHMSEHLLHASVLSMVEFDEDIFAAGNCFDFDQHPLKRGLFCPFAYRLPEPDRGTTFAKDLATEYHYLGNTSEWFYLARKNAEKVIEKNEQYIKAYHLYTNSAEREFDEILSVKYEDGRWSKPYYDCGGGNIWMLTYTVPFFGYDNGTYFFKGTSGIDIDLRRVDIDQCPQRTVAGVTQPLNLFAGTDKCKHRTTECLAISGLGFRRGSYKCTCRKGFYFPDTSIPQKHFNGTALEEEYEKLMMGEPSEYNKPTEFECLPCSEGCDTCLDASPCVAALNWPMRTCILVLACAVIGLLPPATYFTYRYQQVKVLRAASPVLLRVIALGAFLIYCTTLVIYAPPSVYTCTARIWLREIGFSLTYGALMLKTWRISVIFRVRSAKAVKITDASLLKRLGVLCGCVAIALLVRTIVAPPVVVVRRTADDLKAFLCKNDWWDHFFTSMEVLFLAWGVRLCIMVRKAPSEFNESKFISMAIYNEFLLTCFLNVSMLFLQSPANPDLLYIIFFSHTQLTVTLLLALIFGSKVYLVFRSGGKPAEDTIYMGAKSSGAKFITRSQPKTFTNNPSSSSTAQIDPDTDSRFTDDDAVQQIRILCAQLLNLQDRVSVREVASATIATLLENCGSSHASTLRPPPPPNSPPMSHAAAHAAAALAALRTEHGRSGGRLDKATSTSCDNVVSCAMPADGVPSTQCHRCVPLSAGVAMTRTTDDDIGNPTGAMCNRSPSRQQQQQQQTAIIETYPSHCIIRCMCSESSIEEVVQPTGTKTSSATDVFAPSAGTCEHPTAHQSRSPSGSCDSTSLPSRTSAPVRISPPPPPAGHSNILVYAQLGNSGSAQMSSLEVHEELSRNSIVLDDTDYHANDCTLEQDDTTDGDAATTTTTATASDGANGTKTMAPKLVLDLSDRTKYTKEVSV